MSYIKKNGRGKNRKCPKWSSREDNTYPVHIKVICEDIKGILTEVSSIISSFDVNISYAQVETINMIATCNFVIDISSLQQLKSNPFSNKTVENLLDQSSVYIIFKISKNTN